MIKYKTPKNIVRLPKKTSIVVLFITSILLASTFISLSIIDGIKDNIKKNVSQNYNSHLTVFPNQEWWHSRDPIIEKLSDNEYIRGIASRSTFKAFYSGDIIHLTSLENRDQYVFNHYFLPKLSSSSINQVYISKNIAKKYDLQIGDFFPIYIPELNKTYSNFTVSFIFDSPDVFYDNYGVFIHSMSLNEELDSKFKNYHIRFLASPFISIIENTVATDILNYKKEYTDDYLKYQYLQLNTIKKTIHQWIYILYILLGFLFLMLHNLSYNQKDLTTYTYREGFISNKKPVLNLLKSCSTNLILTTILAILLTIIFVSLPVELDSLFFFLPKEPFYTKYNLPMTYYFTVIFPNILVAIPGIILGMLSSLALFLSLSIKPSQEQSTAFVMLGVVLLGIFSTYEYINVNFAKSARNNYWSQYFFGDYMLSGKNYHQQNSFGINPYYMFLPTDIYNVLQENQLSYMSTSEFFGQASATVKSNIVETNDNEITNIETTSTLYKDISIKSLQGNLVQFSNIIESLSQNQVVIGKDVANFFQSNNSITLYAKLPANTKEIPISVSHIIDMPTGDFNNTIFVDLGTFLSIFSIEKNQETTFATKVQLLGREKFLTPFTNENTIISSLNQNTSYWNRLSNINVWALGVKSLLLGLCSAFFVLSIILNTSTSKEKLLTYYIWGIDYNPLFRYSILSSGSFIIGVFLSWIINLLQCLREQSLPEFLYIQELTPKTLNFSPNWTAVPLLLIGFALLFIVVYYIFKHILIQTQKALNKSDLS